MSAVNCFFAAVSFVAVIASTIFSPFMAKGNARSNLKQRLLTHAGFTSILLVIACALQLSAVFSPFRSVTFNIIRGTADIIFAIFHYSSIVVFFMVSDAFRNSYVYFYGRCFTFVKPRQFKTSALISVVPDNRKNMTAITVVKRKIFIMWYSDPDEDKLEEERELEERLRQLREENDRRDAELELYEYATMSCNGDYSSEEPTTSETESESEDDRSDK
uniref:G_PROTEIN_RECEP_F1_2 domain-containing protein n=1 Tax=Panagrellus redivivus TaxID=6233 RepID=A0A7E4VA38_PANRE